MPQVSRISAACSGVISQSGSGPVKCCQGNVVANEPLRIKGVTQNLLHATRMLRKAPRFHLLVALILALGIGANTSICTPVNAALLGPLPDHASSRLVVGNDEATGNVWPQAFFPFSRST